MTARFGGPVPLYNNPPIQPQFYQPRFFFISDVTLGSTTIVTTVVNNDYVIGQQVRLIIPQQFGCRQLNDATGYVISIISPNEVEISIDSRQNVNAFTAFSGATQPQIIAIGDINMGVINTSSSNESTFIPGSFINISPE